MHFIIVILFSSASRRHWLWFSTLQIQDDWFDIKASMVTNTTALQINSLFLELWSLFNTIHDKNVVPVRPWFCELAGGGTATSSGFKKPPPQTTVPVMNEAPVKTLSSEHPPGPVLFSTWFCFRSETENSNVRQKQNREEVRKCGQLALLFSSKPTTSESWSHVKASLVVTSNHRVTHRLVHY